MIESFEPKTFATFDEAEAALQYERDRDEQCWDYHVVRDAATGLYLIKIFNLGGEFAGYL